MDKGKIFGKIIAGLAILMMVFSTGASLLYYLIVA